MLRNWFKLSVLALALFFTVSFAGTRSRERAASTDNTMAPDVIEALDRVIQKRFHDVIGFGMTRVGSERNFSPNTVEEKAAVKNLKSAGYQVTLYLAGRNILQDVPERHRHNRRWFGSLEDHLIGGPVTVGNQDLKRVPDARAIWEPTRDALRQFADGGTRYGFTENGWSVEARPVRALDESCLRCHGFDTKLTFEKDGGVRFSRAQERNGLRVGDPLGVMLYVYKKKN